MRNLFIILFNTEPIKKCYILSHSDLTIKNILSTFSREVLPEVEVSLSYETGVDYHPAVQAHT